MVMGKIKVTKYRADELKHFRKVLGTFNRLYSSASYDATSGLVDQILREGDISEDLLKRIGRILGKRWMRSNEMDKDGKSN